MSTRVLDAAAALMRDFLGKHPEITKPEHFTCPYMRRLFVALLETPRRP